MSKKVDPIAKIESLEVGKPMPWDVYDLAGKLIMRAGSVIPDINRANQFIERGIYREKTEEEIEAEKLGDGPKVSGRFVSPDVVYSNVNKLVEQADMTFPSLIRKPIKDHIIQISKMAKMVFDVCEQNPDMSLGLLHLMPTDQFNVVQTLQCSVICNLLLQKRKLDRVVRLSVIKGALTKDLGMQSLLPVLNKQKDPLTPGQEKTIKAHPTKSVQMLESIGVDDDVWFETILHHHERIDGSGYPNELEADALSEWGRAIAIADIYTAMIRERAYRAPILAKEALREIFISRGKTVDNEMTLTFIKEIGVFPPGAAVRLNNGEVAVVTARGANTTYPVVRAIVAPRGAEYDKPKRRETSVDRGHNIRDLLPLAEYRDLINSYGLKLWMS